MDFKKEIKYNIIVSIHQNFEDKCYILAYIKRVTSNCKDRPQ